MSQDIYWCGKGKYQKEYNQIWEKYVPDSGTSENVYAEQMRVFSRIYYGLFNNGDFSIDNGNYHLDFPKLNKFDQDLPEEIEEFLNNMKDLEDFIYQKGDYADIEYPGSEDESNDDSYYKAYLEKLKLFHMYLF